MPSLPRLSRKTLLPLLSTLVLFLSVWTGVILVQQQQELRERAQSSIPAFPGAEGFGAQSIGGRGGKVFEVTNLNNSGSGSLRACVEASGPRICVFRTGGTIGLSSDLIISNSYITIAGQTAPGGGITLKRASGRGGGLFTIKRGAHDVIIRYIRVRPGTFGGQPDGLAIYGSNVIIDHSSVSWAVDENISTNGSDARNITIQWSITSEGLHCSTHPKGCHSKGLLTGQSPRVSVHHSLLAHNHDRSPRITAGDIDFVNNVIYNWGGAAGYADNQRGPVRMNYVGNYLKPGPDSNTSRAGMTLSGSSHSVYVKGNIGEHSRPSNDLPEWDVIDGSESLRSFSRHNFPQVTTTSAFDAYNAVLAKAGATLPVRDAVDQRIVNDVKNGTGRIIDDPSQVGGWPKLASGTPPVDSDHDGMADNWEISQFGNLSHNGTGDSNNNGYTDLEEYLNSLAGAVPPPPPPPPPGSPTPTPAPTATPALTPTPSPAPTAAPGCQLSKSSWQNFSIAPQTGTFSVEFDAHTPECRHFFPDDALIRPRSSLHRLCCADAFQ